MTQNKEKQSESIGVYEYKSLQEIVDEAKVSGVDLSKLMFKINYGYYDDMEYCFEERE